MDNNNNILEDQYDWYFDKLEEGKKSKEEIEEEERKKQEQIKKRREIRLEKCPILIEEGKKYIYKEKYEEWEKKVNYYISDIYIGDKIIETALKLMQLIQNGVDKNEAKDLLNKICKVSSYEYEVRFIILRFSKYGPDFFEHTMEYSERCNERYFDLIQKIRNENKRLEIINSSESSIDSTKIKNLKNNEKKMQ